MLNAQMLQASHADRSQDELMAAHRRELREARGSAPQRGRRLKRLVAATAALVLIGGASDALAATNARFDSGRRCSASHTRHTSRTAVTDMRFRWRA